METLQAGRSRSLVHARQRAGLPADARAARPTPVGAHGAAAGARRRTRKTSQHHRVHAPPGAAGRGQRRMLRAADARGRRRQAPALAEHCRSGARAAVHRGGARGAGEDRSTASRPGTRIRSSSDALVTVRRSFHTLKGSGRMVGARDLGEFAWSIENLLNRAARQHADALAGDPGDAARSGGRAARADRAAGERRAAAGRSSPASSLARARARGADARRPRRRSRRR